MGTRLLTPFRAPRPQSGGGASSVINGYLARAVWNVQQAGRNSGPSAVIKSATACWQVPDPPANEAAQTLFLFLGMESDSSSAARSILQPVLHWGSDQNGSRQGWVAASYCVCGSPGNLRFAAMTAAIPVATGDKLKASITLQSKDEQTFGYLSQFEGITGSSLYIESSQELVQVGIALEAYNLADLSELPNSQMTRFSPVQVVTDDNQTASPEWQITNSEPTSNVRAVSVLHAGIQDEIDICYR